MGAPILLLFGAIGEFSRKRSLRLWQKFAVNVGLIVGFVWTGFDILTGRLS